MTLPIEIIDKIIAFNHKNDQPSDYCKGYLINKELTLLYLERKFEKQFLSRLVNTNIKYHDMIKACIVDHYAGERFDFKLVNCTKLAVLLRSYETKEIAHMISKENFPSLTYVKYQNEGTNGLVKDLEFLHSWDKFDAITLILTNEFPTLNGQVFKLVKELILYPTTINQSKLNQYAKAFPNCKKLRIFHYPKRSPLPITTVDLTVFKSVEVVEYYSHSTQSLKCPNILKSLDVTFTSLKSLEATVTSSCDIVFPQIVTDFFAFEFNASYMALMKSLVPLIRQHTRKYILEYHDHSLKVVVSTCVDYKDRTKVKCFGKEYVLIKSPAHAEIGHFDCFGSEIDNYIVLFIINNQFIY